MYEIHHFTVQRDPRIFTQRHTTSILVPIPANYYEYTRSWQFTVSSYYEYTRSVATGKKISFPLPGYEYTRSRFYYF